MQVAFTVMFPAVVMLLRSESNRIASKDAGFPTREYLGVEVAYDGPPADAATSDTGAALATLHAQNPDGLQRWTRAEEADYLLGLSWEIAFICPGLSGLAEKLARRLVSRLHGAPAMDHTVHGDFSDGQVLIDGREVAIVDLDSSYRGDPADDLGSLLAQLETYAMRGRLPVGAVEMHRCALLGGYRRVARQASADRIGFYTAAGLLRRARFAFRARKDRWGQVIEASLARADAILDAHG